jgi:hypothetical protein
MKAAPVRIDVGEAVPAAAVMAHEAPALAALAAMV